jgi:hypothetical protein
MILTLAQVKNFLGITTNTYDTLLTEMIEIVESELSSYLSRPLEQKTYTDYVLNYMFSRFDRGVQSEGLSTREEYGRLKLPQYPVTTFTNLKYDNTVIDTGDYYVNKDKGIIHMFRFYSDFNGKLTGTFTAGYTSTTIPSVLKGIIYDGVKFLFETNKEAVKGSKIEDIESKRVGDFSVSYKDNSEAAKLGLSDYFVKKQNVLKNFMSINL